MDSLFGNDRARPMTATDNPKPLAFPVPFPDVPSFLIVAEVPRDSVPDYLGPVMLTDSVDGRGNADFWAFEYPCGLQVVFEFSHQTEGGLILADSPEIDHILRHIPFPPDSCVRIDQDTLDSQLKRLVSAYPERQAEVQSLHSYQVWRQGTDGNPFKVGNPTSKRDAECWVKHFDSLGHHQHYWSSKIETK